MGFRAMGVGFLPNKRVRSTENVPASLAETELSARLKTRAPMPITKGPVENEGPRNIALSELGITP